MHERLIKYREKIAEAEEDVPENVKIEAKVGLVKLPHPGMFGALGEVGSILVHIGGLASQEINECLDEAGVSEPELGLPVPLETLFKNETINSYEQLITEECLSTT